MAFFYWETEEPSVQLSKDPVLIPIGMGAIFIPSMTKSAIEPPGELYAGDTKIGEIPVGFKYVVSPGIYQLTIGSGIEAHRLKISVTVNEQHTTIIDPEWSILVIRIVNQRNTSFRGSYELIEMDTKDNIGMGLGAKEENGEMVQAWILKPGIYKILKTGSNYRSLQNFFTFRLERGEFHNYTLVINEDTGDFLGAGIIDESIQTKQVGNWKYFITLSGDLLMNVNNNIKTKQEGASFSSAFIYDASVRYNFEKESFFTRMEGELGYTKYQKSELRKEIDKFAVDSIYIYRLLSWFGPYTRAGLSTQLLQQDIFFDTPTDIKIITSKTASENKSITYDSLKSGEVLEVLKQQDEIKTSSSFTPLIIREGIGGNFDIFNSSLFDLYFRTGFGARQNFADGLLSQLEDENGGPDNRIFIKGKNDYNLGSELTLLSNAYIFNVIGVNSELDIFLPFNDMNSPFVEWGNTVTIRLSSYSSLNFTLDMEKNENTQNEFQKNYRILLRFSISLL